MLFSRNRNEWKDIVEKTCDIEFDYVAIDNKNQIGVFSTFNRGYRPNSVTQSFDLFLELDTFIESLPLISKTVRMLPGKDNLPYESWELYAAKGIFSYDNQDVHRDLKKQKLQYDIIYIPASPLLFHDIPLIEKYLSIIPRFNISFGRDIKFDHLQTSIIK